MTLQETIRALREYARTPQTGPDATDLAGEYRALVGDSVSRALRAWGKDDGALRGEAEKLAGAMNDTQLGNRELDAVLRGVAAAALDVLNDRGTIPGDRADRALDLICVSADANDPAILAAVDAVNAARGVAGRPHSAQYVKLENYGVDRMNGRGRRGAEYLRGINRELLEQARRAESADAVRAKTANANVKELLVRKMYLKAAAAPNALVDPQAVETAARELSADAALMDRLAAAKDAKVQERLLREHIHRLVRGEPEPQAEKTAGEKTLTAEAAKRPDEPRTLGG